MRNVSAASKAILKNEDAIKVSQDPLGQMGIRLTPDIPQQIWSRVLANGDVAVALYNKGDAAPPKQPPIPHGAAETSFVRHVCYWLTLTAPRFAKTGSGQASEKLNKSRAFSGQQASARSGQQPRTATTRRPAAVPATLAPSLA